MRRYLAIAVAGAVAAAAILGDAGGGRASRGPRARVRSPQASPGALPARAEGGEAPPGTVGAPDPFVGFHAALEVRDADRLGAAADGVAEWIGDDEGRALGATRAFRAESDPAALDLLAFALAGSAGAAGSTSVAREMLSIACGDPCAARRRSALLFLSRAGASSADMQREGLWIAQTDADPLVRAAAFALLQGIASSDPAAGARLAPQVLVEAERSEDPSVRIAALSAIAVRDASEEILRGIGQRLRTDVAPLVRLQAVALLTDTSPGERPLAVEFLRVAAAGDGDLEVRRACVEAVARIGGLTGATVLEGLSERDPDLAREIADLAAVLRTGETDWERIREELARREQARR